MRKYALSRPPRSLFVLLLLLLTPGFARAEPARASSLREQSTVAGGTGLLHLEDPLASAPGTFRMSLLFDTYKGTGFLCSSGARCPGVGEDVASHFGTTLGLAVAPLPFLEAYASLDSFVNSNSASSPSLISAVGNTTFALKGFTPTPAADLFRFGAALELGLLGSSGVVGVAGSGTSARLLALAQADFRGTNQRGVPLRARVNVGYSWDNSANLVGAVEAGRGAPVTRIERFGLGINRVDQFQLGLGFDGLLGVARPFAEWNLGVPVNRQGYRCYPTRSSPGDGCLALDSRLSAFPSKLTIGARLFPWLTGLSATAALDIGTTGTSNFIEELAPTLPWALWLGIGYGVDVIPPPPPPVAAAKPIEKVVLAPRPPELHLRGLVHEEGKEDGIPKAIVTYDGRDLTGMVTSPSGRFTSQALEPGTYTLSVEAAGYEPGQCSGTASSDQAVTLDCPLKPLPSFGTLSGQVRDGASLAPVGGAALTLRDNLGHAVSVTAEASGAFHFPNLAPGTMTLSVEADGYLLHGEPVEIGARAETRLDIALRRRPKPPHVKQVAKEIALLQPIRFEGDGIEPTPDSVAVLEEVADLLARAPELGHIEIQVHSDATGDAARDEALTQRRASALRDWLTKHGVAEGRVSARGYGSAQPLSPNVTPAGRARNRRVKLVIGD
jgi:outer membrane protein OmpA-like peptidoglycan-associated protein